MQIKVNNTRMRQVLQLHLPESTIERYSQVPVADGKLILLSVENSNLKTEANNIIIYEHLYKPIIISETEKIDIIGGYYYDEQFKTIGIADDIILKVIESGNGAHFKKILVLPEQFSPKHLQAIVDGKMKDGDKVAVECENGTWTDSNTGLYVPTFDSVIKLNSQGHVTLHKVEEKMVPISLVEKAFEDGKLRGMFDLSESRTWSKFTTAPLSKEKWFEQNIK